VTITDEKDEKKETLAVFACLLCGGKIRAGTHLGVRAWVDEKGSPICAGGMFHNPYPDVISQIDRDHPVKCPSHTSAVIPHGFLSCPDCGLTQHVVVRKATNWELQVTAQVAAYRGAPAIVVGAKHSPSCNYILAGGVLGGVDLHLCSCEPILHFVVPSQA
jgi:hypothetical protein